jgi:hypothetical protein
MDQGAENLFEAFTVSRKGPFRDVIVAASLDLAGSQKEEDEREVRFW